MSINQISSIEAVMNQLKPVTSAGENTEISFSDIFKSAIDNVKQAEENVKEAELMVATGKSDDLHTVMINAAKADMALTLLVQMRNKALDAYNEIMRITL